MEKKKNSRIVDDIDETFLLNSIAEPGIRKEAPIPSVEAVIEEKSEPAPEPVKEESKKKRSKQDYEAMFIRESDVTARLGKTVYIRREFHDKILKIVQVIGENEVTLFSYIDNIIAHHFDLFQDDIVRLYNQKNNSIF